MRFKIVICLLFLLLTGIPLQSKLLKVANKRVLNSAELYLLAPKCSPDGNFIAAAGEGYQSIWIFDLSKQQWQKLVEENAAGWDFDWSPDSRRIAFRSNEIVRRRKLPSIKWVEITSGKVQIVVAKDRSLSAPQWISSSEIAYIQNNAYKTHTLATKGAEINTTAKKRQNICLWSDGELFFKESKYSLINLDSIKLQMMNLTFSDNGDYGVIEKMGSEIILFTTKTSHILSIAKGEMPAWSPDGNSVVYATPSDDGHNFLASDIWIYDLSERKNQNLTQTPNEIEMRPNWSPDGKKIVCDAMGKILLMQVEIE